MSIRLKIILVVLPLIIAAVVLAGMSSYFSAASAVTRVTTQFLSFKASELQKYADGQWNLLAANGLTGRADIEEAARAAVQSFALSILRSGTETIVALDEKGAVAMRAGPAEPSKDEAPALSALSASGKPGFATVRMGGAARVASYFRFEPFGWLVLVTEDRAVFYGDVEGIFRSTLLVLGFASLVAVLLLLLTARYLTRPLEEVSATMRRIIATSDFSERVPVQYKDEIGQVSHNFNMMLSKLGEAYASIKDFAFKAAVAKKKETKIRNIFQLYVPKNVIDEYFQNPEAMLKGNNREVAILFSDIRSFTTISEKMPPDDLVTTLNRYFSLMVDTIMDRGGLVDKYIGDAIMATFGMTAPGAEDALRSVQAGLEMGASLDTFNAGQRKRGEQEFRIGIGINYGEVTVGNIGSEKKMNYTVIGDGVNLASRLEGATKLYLQPILISQSVRDRVQDRIPCRQVDCVAVKGKSEGVRIYTARASLTPSEQKAWAVHAEAVRAYYSRDFKTAAQAFREVLNLLPGDQPASLYLERSMAFSRSAPGPEWDGVEVLTEK
jgi:class 3 adenylate cyclase/HAMP domain-containing protein